MFKLIVVLGLLLLAFYFLKQIIQFLKQGIFKNKPAFDNVDTQIDNLKNKIMESGKKSVKKEINKMFSKNPKLSFAKNFVSELLKSSNTNSKTKKSENLDDEEKTIIATLLKLGIKKQNALKALKNLPKDFNGTIEEKIKQILKNLNEK